MLDSLFLSRLMAQPRGRAFLLSFMANAEESDEGAFDALAAQAAAPEVQKMVRLHAEDEARHARLLRACLLRNGVEPEPLPAELRYIDRIDRMTGGGFRARFLEAGDLGIMRVYAMLELVEERGVVQFPRIAAALAPHDPQSARVIEEITVDEERHVKYARAITRRYAPDAATLERTMSEFRAIEARAFDDHGRAFFAHAVARGLVGVHALERLAWKTVALAA
ncbi:MAG: ferritin-like domain-containing protein [Polyangia bacterium]